MVCFVIISVAAVTTYKFVPVKYPSSVVLQQISLAIDGDTTTVKHKWVPMKDISPYMTYTAICSEDYTFYQHIGIDFSNIRKAIRTNIRRRGIVTAGSTITQQTAKNVFLCHNRIFLRKILDVWFTFLQELIWGKERIMEVYLNSIEFGPNIYGIESAANEFYGISAKDLSLEQCIMLTSLVVRPKVLNINKPDRLFVWRVRYCIGILKKFGYISNEEFEYLKKKYGVEYSWYK